MKNPNHKIHISPPRFKRLFFFGCGLLAWHNIKEKKISLKRLVSAPVLGSPLNLETLSTVLHKVHHPHNQARFLPENKIAFWQWTSRKCRSGNPGLTSGCKIILGVKWTREPVSPVLFLIMCTLPQALEGNLPLLSFSSMSKLCLEVIHETHKKVLRGKKNQTQAHIVSGHQCLHSTFGSLFTWYNLISPMFPLKQRKRVLFSCYTPSRWKLNCLISAHLKNWVSWIIHWPGGMGQD